MADDEEMRIAPDRTAKLVSDVLDGVPVTWRVRGNADGSISICRPTRKAGANDD